MTYDYNTVKSFTVVTKEVHVRDMRAAEIVKRWCIHGQCMVCFISTCVADAGNSHVAEYAMRNTRE